jgi:hypothetical protein
MLRLTAVQAWLLRKSYWTGAWLIKSLSDDDLHILSEPCEGIHQPAPGESAKLTAQRSTRPGIFSARFIVIDSSDTLVLIPLELIPGLVECELGDFVNLVSVLEESAPRLVA